MLDFIFSFIAIPQFNPAACALPDLPTKSAPKAAVPSSAGKARRLEGEAQVFVWDLGRDAGKVDRQASAALTPYDVGLLAQRNFNPELAAQLKPLWVMGKTASEAAKEVRCSHDYAKKIFGTFTKALDNEKAGA